jgi:hypothetical protein
MARWLRLGGAALVVLLVATVGAGLGARWAFGAPLPAGETGPEAEALAQEVVTRLGGEAWARTGAVRFAIFGHRYLWDRQRGLVRYEDGRGVVLTEAWRPMGRAFRDGVEVGGSWKDKRVRTAYASFVNDAFWAFAPLTLTDEGPQRAIVRGEGGPFLLLTYPSGGVTPGDSYQWELGPDGLPVAWRMWTQVLPLPGARVRWTGWRELPNGVWVAERRQGGLLGFSVDDLAVASTLAELEPGPDPFAPMFRAPE